MISCPPGDDEFERSAHLIADTLEKRVGEWDQDFLPEGRAVLHALLADGFVRPSDVAAMVRVIGRLLDGWRDAKRKGGTEDVWYKPGKWESMAPSEAAIIRAHQEKTQ